MVACAECCVLKMIDSLDATGRAYDVRINVKKTKTKAMAISRHGNVKLNIAIYGNKVGQVKKFRYLAALVTDYGRCEADVSARVAMAKEAFNGRRELLTSNLVRRLK